MRISHRFFRLVATVALLAAMAFSVSAASRPPEAQAANCFFLSWWQCSWGGATAAGGWFFFDGANPARNWFYNRGTDHYANPVGKCVRAGKGGGVIYAQTCGYTTTVAQNYPQCSCGGLYAGTQNLASGVRNIGSGGFH